MNYKFLSTIGLVLVALVMICPSEVSALHCWQCNTESDKDCDVLPTGPVANVSSLSECIQKYYVECLPDDKKGAPFCRKQEQTIHSVKRIIRSCAFERSTSDSYTVKNPSVVSVVNQCYSDGCNGAFSLNASFGLLVLLAFAARVFFIQ